MNGQLRDQILRIVKENKDYAISIEGLYKKLFKEERNYDPNRWNDVEDVLKDLENDKLLVQTKKGLFRLNMQRVGKAHVTRNGTVFVTVDDLENDLKIKDSRTLRAMDGDTVLIEITDTNTFEGEIKDVIERKGIVAEVKTINGKRYAIVKDNKYEIDLSNDIVDGMLIGIKVDNKGLKPNHAELDKVLAHKNAVGLDEITILYEHGFTDGFTDEAKAELKSIPDKVTEEDIKGRTDLRKEVIFTIDGDDTKDIDDAISIDILDNGNYLLGVHIADVANYVKENSLIDLEAREKGTSVYMPGVVSPMYPVELSNGICSLNPNIDRLAISCEMEIDKNGRVVDSNIFESVIHSNIQMTYNNVNKILEENIVPDGYEPYVEKLRQMKDLAEILRASRVKRGYLNFEESEIKFETDDKGRVTNVTKRHSGIGENLIEDFMLTANECVARYQFLSSYNCIYRVHDLPNEEMLKDVIKLLKTYGVEFDFKVRYNDATLVQKMLNSLKENELFWIFSNLILRCMDKAKYSTINTGHFGVGVNADRKEAYCHFTSPIRRYPDTMVHRLLKMALHGDIDKLTSGEYTAYLEEIARHSSEMEVGADKCERVANKMKAAEYMEQFVGEEFEAKISGFTKSGMFVALENLIEGRVDFSSMDDFYRYEKELERIVGEKSNKVYRLGDMIDVLLVRASKDEKEIDFKMTRKRISDRNGNNKPQS